MELSGQVLSVEEITGQKTNGEDWTRYEVTINHIQGKYPKNATLRFHGEKWIKLKEYVGKQMKVYFDIHSFKKNEITNTYLQAYRFEVLPE